MSAIIEVEGLTRRYGELEAVSSLSFTIEPGQVVGFVGANGAGKTTTMRIMATLEMPTLGALRICGYDVVNFPAEVRRRIGWMPDAFGAYEYVTVYEYLDFFARAYGFRGRERRERVQEVMQFTDLAEIADRSMNTLSKGMGQRLCLGRTLLNDPEVLILDEPAAGLDPKARVDLIHLIRLLAEDGKTVFISSHILSELGQMCDSLLFIDHGRLVHHGSADSLTLDREAGAVVLVRVADGQDRLREWVLMQPGVRMLDEVKEGLRLLFEEDKPEAMAEALRRMVEAGIPVVEFTRERRRLEDAFVSILQRGVVPPPLPMPGEAPRV
jgi:ABC-2 type transport system ATP-binding protein